MNDDDDLNETLKELISPIIRPFMNFYCDKCSSSLEDYGAEPLIFGKDDFIDLILCGKCAADYLGEEDYHSEKIRNEFESIVLESSDDEQIRNCDIQKTTHEVLKSLALGMTEKEILNKYPNLSHKDILACYEFAVQRI